MSSPAAASPRQRVGPPGTRPVFIDGQLRWIPVAAAAADAAVATAAGPSSSADVAPSPTHPAAVNAASIAPAAPSVFAWAWGLLSCHPLATAALVAWAALVLALPSTELRVGASGVLISAAGIAYMCLSARSRPALAPGELSAYSIFNPRGQRIMGTLTASQFDAEMRGGAGALQDRQRQGQGGGGAGVPHDVRWRLAGQGHTLGAGGGGGGAAAVGAGGGGIGGGGEADDGEEEDA